MTFRDVPNLLKFEQHARNHPNCPITMDTYRRVRDIIAPAPKPSLAMDPFSAEGEATVQNLKAGCEAIEKSTRILWACAAATNCVEPPLWDYTPDYESVVDYFLNLPDLELMSVTKKHRINWEKIF